MSEPAAAHQAATAAAPVPLRPGLFVPDEGGRLRLAGSRCPRCGACYFPRRLVCARCLATDLEVVGLSSRGTVYTYTVVHQSTPEFPTPYVLAYVDLPDGVRVLAPLADIDPSDVRIGAPVDLRVEPVRATSDGRPVLAYRGYPCQVPHGQDVAREVRDG
ncbi:MAG: Zn-ribbon domain-containing OB-fold protein [Armatimonadota bacterium]|nr:Zn-ribbon domain-containing OB-fold protein [Armatimonadota bacterium]MDR7486035.1 Zn-ribbon domain-containing OB-fold protein [Armatimonadota bacterium]MDR7532606.1 Zn-ribbon domain-containing OB-fold protein [Armatimonadota bacterium]MDR7536185.1 Zn-ribbon domain-containing OB-fold protein [Armatimonadota bacterium]